MPEERAWKLGDDLSTHDNLLDPITFDELILTAHCNCRELTREAVIKECKEIILMKIEDAKELLERNLDEIIAEAKKGRSDYEEAA